MQINNVEDLKKVMEEALLNLEAAKEIVESI